MGLTRDVRKPNTSNRYQETEQLAWSLRVDNATGSWKFLVPTFQLIQVFRFFEFILLLFLEFSSQDILQTEFVVLWSFFSRQDSSLYQRCHRLGLHDQIQRFPRFCLTLALERSEFPTESFILQEVTKQQERNTTKNKEQKSTLTNQTDKSKKHTKRLKT